MSWSAMVTEEQALEQIKSDHGMAASRMLTLRRSQHRPMGGFVMFDRGFLDGWWQGVAWLLHMQGEYESLTAGEAITELRKGDQSIYWPIKRGDPTLWVDCPEGHRTLVDERGICDEHGIEVI